MPSMLEKSLPRLITTSDERVRKMRESVGAGVEKVVKPLVDRRRNPSAKVRISDKLRLR